MKSWIYYRTILFDHHFREEKETEDVVDSDFDIDENDEPVSDQEDEAKEKRKVNAKAYKVCLPCQYK